MASPLACFCQSGRCSSTGTEPQDQNFCVKRTYG